MVPRIDQFLTGGRARPDGEELQTQDGSADRPAETAWLLGVVVVLNFGQLVLSQGIIDLAVVSMYGTQSESQGGEIIQRRSAKRGWNWRASRQDMQS